MDINESVIVEQYKKSPYYKKKTVEKLLRCTDDRKSPLWEEALACTPNDTVSRQKISDSVIQSIAPGGCGCNGG